MSAGPGNGRWGDLDRPPLRMDALRRALLAPDGPIARLELVDRAGSTNADLLAAASQPSPVATQTLSGSDVGTDQELWPHLSALVADHQTSGRGRLDRSWQTPPRTALTFSLLVRPGSVPMAAWSWVPLLTGLAVVRALRAVAGVPAGLKWPNDVLVGDLPEARKVAGVLVEVASTPSGPALVVGVGVNVTSTRAELPVPTATSLRLEGSATTDRDTLLRALLRELAAVLERWRRAGGDAAGTGLAAGVREVCLTLGRTVRIEQPGSGSTLVGVAEGLVDDGRLLVRADGSEPVAVAAGDVVHLRDTGSDAAHGGQGRQGGRPGGA